MDVCCVTFKPSEVAALLAAEGIREDSEEFFQVRSRRYRPVDGMVEGEVLFVERDDWIPDSKSRW